MADAPILSEVLTVLRSRRDAARQNRFDIVGVFGSVARGEADADSDVDIIIRAIDPKADLFDMGAIWSDLAVALGRKVDLVEIQALRPSFRAGVERDLALL